MAVTAQERKLLIGGEWIETGDWIDVASPYSGETVGRVAKAGADETRRAIDAAEAAMLKVSIRRVTSPAESLIGLPASTHSA